VIGVAGDQTVGVPGSKGSSSAHQEGRFQQGGFA
jgi:hypothetical protein